MVRVVRQIPNIREGKEGEMRLLLLPKGGSLLYVKGGNQWHAIPSTEFNARYTRRREDLGTLERQIKSVADPDADGIFEGDGSITGGSGGGGSGGGSPL